MFDKTKYLEYLKTDSWKDKRREALRRAGYCCTVCGSKEGLNVHHKHYKTLFHERLCDLDVLCRLHHRLEHGIRSVSKGVRSIPAKFYYFPLAKKKRKIGTWKNITNARKRT